MNDKEHNYESYPWHCSYCGNEDYELAFISHKDTSMKVRSFGDKTLNIRRGNIDIVCPRCGTMNFSKDHKAADFFASNFLSGKGKDPINEVNLNCFNCGKVLLGKLLFSENLDEMVFSVIGTFRENILMNPEGILIYCPECNKGTLAHKNREINTFLENIINPELRKEIKSKEKLTVG